MLSLRFISLVCKVLVLALIVDIGNFSSIQDPNSQNRVSKRSYEALFVGQHGYRFVFEYEDKLSNIPKSLIRLLAQTNVQKLVLQMGMVNPSMRVKQVQIKENHSIIPGISLYLFNSTQLDSEDIIPITQVFSISRSLQHIIYLPQAKVLFLSNPNDKFCSQHLSQIIRTFLPCQSINGIGSLINQKSIFLDRQFLGFRLSWEIGKTIKIQIKIDNLNDRQIRRYLTTNHAKRLQKRCKHFKNLFISQNRHQQPLQSFQRNNIPQTQISTLLHSSQTVKFLSNYYHPQKSLVMNFNLSQFLRTIDHTMYLTKIQNVTLNSRILFPKGFQIRKINAKCKQSSQNASVTCQQLMKSVRIQSIHLPKIMENKIPEFSLLPSNYVFSSIQQQNLIMLTMNIQSNNWNISHNETILQTIKTNYLSLQVIVNYTSSLKPFENYQTIAGGGEEFMNIPLTVKIQHDNRTTVMLLGSNQMSNMFDRLLQPDFSIPFKTLTFFTAIFAYLWIAVWRAFFTQQENISKKSPQQQNKQYNLQCDQHQKESIPQSQNSISSQTNNIESLTKEFRQ